MTTTTEAIMLEEIKLSDQNQSPKDADKDIDPEKAYWKKPIRSWLSSDIQLNDFEIRTQEFRVTGFINVHWRWPKYDKLHLISNLVTDYFFKNIDINDDEDADESVWKYDTNKNVHIHKNGNVSNFILRGNKDRHNDRILLIKDLSIVRWNNKLPIDTRKLFDDRSTICKEYVSQPCLYYNSDTGAAHLMLKFKATLFEQLELFAWPFDDQFLNIKLAFNDRLFQMVKPNNGQISDKDDIYEVFKEVPGGYGRFKGIWQDMVKVTLNESLSNELIMEAPLVYFDKAIGWIRLRTSRKPNYFVLSSIFPIFVVVSSSMCSFWFDDKEAALAYAITVLLAYAATQSVISDELPKVSDLLFCDYYVFISYSLQFFIIVMIIAGKGIYIERYDDDEDYNMQGIICFAVVSLIWISMNLLYCLLYCRCCRKNKCCQRCVQKIYGGKCCRKWCSFCSDYCLELTINWETRSKIEIEHWKQSTKDVKELVTNEEIKEYGYDIGGNYDEPI
eukprot:71155_1